jgi:pyrroloquinoline quinone biosynthesis protein B
MGHYSGLLYLGRECVDWSRVPTYCTARMADFLVAHEPWKSLTERNLELRLLEVERSVTLAQGLAVTPIQVPHRDELSDTVGFLFEGERRLFYVPDCDRWEAWKRDIREIAATVDDLLVDGTFSDAGEIGRNPGEVPHPMIPHSRSYLKGIGGTVWFTHLNHSNPALYEAEDVVRPGQQFAL